MSVMVLAFEKIYGRFTFGRSYRQSHISRFCTSDDCRETLELDDTYEVLRCLCRKGYWKRAINLLDLKKNKSKENEDVVELNLFEAYTCLLKECTQAKTLIGAYHIHDHIRENGFAHNSTLSNLLLDVYMKCGSFKDVENVFESMPHKDTDTWTSMIGFYVRSNHLEHAFNLFSTMVNEGVNFNGVTCVNALKACTTSSSLMHVHAFVIGHGPHYNLYVRNTLLDMYCKHGSIEDALYLFVELPVFSIVSWNTIISGLVQHGLPEKAFELFHDMKSKGFKPDEVTFLCVIKACTNKLELLHQLHAEMNSNALESDSFIASALIDMYATFGNMSYAHMILERVSMQDVPLWNSIILAYAEHGDAAEAIGFFRKMEKEKSMAPDKVTYLSLLKACARMHYLAMGQSVYSRITQCGMGAWPFVGSAIVDMYAKCGVLEDARHVFDYMTEQDLVSWNAIIAAYCVHESPIEALVLFQKMVKKDVKPDKVTFLTILKSCANLGAFEHGRCIHACIYDNGFDSDVFVGSTLIDMYGKCGMPHHAREVFETMSMRDEVSWSAMIAGYGQLGMADKAVEVFLEMERECVRIDDITLVGILCACTHSGLVKEGCAYFDMMKKRHGILPTSEVCACMVDLLGRAGQITEALAFIKVVEVEPTASVWMALLNACKLSGDINLAQYASQKR